MKDVFQFYFFLIKTVDELTKLLRDVVCKVLKQSRWFENQHFQKKKTLTEFILKIIVR